MILALDLGNSRSKWGLFEDGKLVRHGLIDDFELHRDNLQAIRAVGICSVIESGATARVMRVLESTGLPPGLPVHMIRAQEKAAGVTNLYTDPLQLGADRFAAAVAVRHRTHEPALIVMAGTASTIDALDGDGQFLGGLILPGLQVMRQSLSLSTHQIAMHLGHHTAFPKNTGDAVYSGAIEATLGAIERQFARLQARLGETPQLVISGGAGPLITEALDESKLRYEYIDTLVLEGVAALS